MIYINANMPKCCMECPAFHEGNSYNQLYDRCEATHNDRYEFGNPLEGFPTHHERPV